MPVFNYVEVWPATGWPHRPWTEDADEEAFVKSARAITELYTEALIPLAVKGHRSMLRLRCWPGQATREVTVKVNAQRSVDFEMASVGLPAGIADLASSARGLLVLNVVHGAVKQLAEIRGWSKAQFDRPRQHVLDAGLVYRWDGPWKASPNRRFRARGRYRLLDHGYGRALIEVKARDSDATVAASDEALAFSTSESFKRSSRTLRWQGSSAVRLTPYSGLARDEWHGLVRLDLTDDAWHSTTNDGIYQGLPPGASTKKANTAEFMPSIVFLGDENRSG